MTDKAPEQDVSRRPGLDTPLRARSRWLPRPRPNPDAFGEATEGLARFMGTPQFILWMTLFCLLWLGWNTVAPAHLRFDSAALGFTALTLMLSLQASYAAPLLLLAQNRQDDRDRVGMREDRTRAERNLADTEYLTRELAGLRIALQDVATRDFVRSEMRSAVEDISDELATEAAEELRARIRAEVHEELGHSPGAGSRADSRADSTAGATSGKPPKKNKKKSGTKDRSGRDARERDGRDRHDGDATPVTTTTLAIIAAEQAGQAGRTGQAHQDEQTEPAEHAEQSERPAPPTTEQPTAHPTDRPEDSHS